MRGMHQHPRRLIYDNNIAVFVNDIEIDVLRTHRGLTVGVEDYFEQIVRFEAMSDVLITAIHLTTPRLYGVAQIHFAQVREMVEQKVLKPEFIGSLRHNDDDAFVHTEIVQNETKSGTLQKPAR